MNATVAPTGLSQTQANAYWTRGFVSGVPILSRAEATAYRERLEAIEAEQRAEHGGTWADRHDYPWLHETHPIRDLIYELATRPQALDAVEAILGPNVLIRNADVFIKEAGMRRTVDWHLDTSMRDGTEDAYVSMWLGLGEEGSTPQNGCLWFREGAHRLDLPDRPTDRHHLTLSEAARAVLDPSRKVPNVMQPGYASFHHALMPHFSGANTTKHRRIGIVVRYMGTGISKDMAESGIATLVRGQDDVGTFSLKPHFPTTWTPQVP